MSRLDQLQVSSGVAAGIVTSGVATATVIYQPVVLLGAVAALLVLIVGVVLPAVWSRKNERRAAAARVLCKLLSTVRPAIAQPVSSPRGRSTPDQGFVV